MVHQPRVRNSIRTREPVGLLIFDAIDAQPRKVGEISRRLVQRVQRCRLIDQVVAQLHHVKVAGSNEGAVGRLP